LKNVTVETSDSFQVAVGMYTSDGLQLFPDFHYWLFLLVILKQACIICYTTFIQWHISNGKLPKFVSLQSPFLCHISKYIYIYIYIYTHTHFFSHTIQIKRNVHCLFLYGTTSTKLPWTLLHTIKYETSLMETVQTMFWVLW